MNSDSQETVRWYADVLAAAARHRLMVDLHGAYKPTGLARTWPNYITQEGVLGNEYNKIRAGRCTTLHTITLPFTRGMLGPMDFTPGGFLNRTAADFKVTRPAEVVGTRARQLAETVVYFSPQLCLCDSLENYRGQPGMEFFRGLPTVWDDAVVLSAEVVQYVVIARRSGSRWHQQVATSPRCRHDDECALPVPFRHPPIMTDTFLKLTEAAAPTSLLAFAASAFAQGRGHPTYWCLTSSCTALTRTDPSRRSRPSKTAGPFRVVALHADPPLRTLLQLLNPGQPRCN